MTSQLVKRLNEILPKITSPEFLSGQGLGNEIPFHIFDYEPEYETDIRKHLVFLEQQIPKQFPDLSFKHVNLFEFLIRYLEGRNKFDKSLEMEERQGSEKTLKVISSVANAESLAKHFADEVLSQNPGLVIVSGVGSAFPIVRTHELLNNLHKYMEATPLVLFYPGVYDKTTLKLFGKASLGHDSESSDRSRKSRYYRAFKLID